MPGRLENEQQKEFEKELKKQTNYIAKSCIDSILEYAEENEIEPYYFLEEVAKELNKRAKLICKKDLRKL